MWIFYTVFLSLSFPSHYGQFGNWCTLILHSCSQGNKEKRTFTSTIFLHLLARFTWTLIANVHEQAIWTAFFSLGYSGNRGNNENKLTITQAVIFRALLLRVVSRRKKSCYTVIEKYRELFHLQFCWFNNSFDTNYLITTHYYTLSNT